MHDWTFLDNDVSLDYKVPTLGKKNGACLNKDLF